MRHIREFYMMRYPMGTQLVDSFEEHINFELSWRYTLELP